jgi:4-amino-4-deoxy-L-arabinose transferase-like glycosyltransferase
VTNRRFAYALAALAVAGLALRWFWILEVRPECGPVAEEGPPGCLAIVGGPNVVNDPRYLHEEANLIAHGHLFVDPFTFRSTGEERPSAHKMPLFPLYLSVISSLGGEGVDTHRLAAAALGAGTVVVLGLIGRLLMGWRAGLIAAAIGAFYPNLWINDFLLQVETLAAFLVALTILCAYRYWQVPGRRRIAVLGVVIALTALTRAEALLLYAVVALPLVLGAVRAWRERLAQLGIAAAAAVILIGPWVAWNLVRFEEPVTLSTAPGPVLDTASCDATYYGDQLGYYAGCFRIEDFARDEGLSVPEAEELLRSYDESQRAQVAGDRASAYIRDHLRRLPVVMVARVARMWDLYRPGQNVRFNWQLEGRGERLSQVALVSYYVLLPFGVAGVVVLRRRRIPISPLVGMVVMISATAAWTFGTTRYRVPGDVALAVGAAVAVEALLQRRWPLGEGDPA